MAHALQYLHSQHPPVIHRDFKPDNIISKKDALGHIVFKIADFGLARVLGKNVYGEYYAMSQVGTPIYMAPEALRVRKLFQPFCYEIILTPTSGNFLCNTCRYVVPGCSDVILLQPATPLQELSVR